MRIEKGRGRTARWLLAVVMAFGVSAAMAQITGTKHNLGSGGTAGNNRVTGAAGPPATATGTTEICVFCHTPHAADVSTAGLPLWNKALPASATYSTYQSSTMDAGRATDGVSGSVSIGSVSLACLSCHDGTQAMDNIRNAPGSGGYDVTGGGLNGLAYTWDTTTLRVNADGKMLNAGDSLAMLGQDLNNDHPIGIQYCGGGYTTASLGSSTGSGDCVDADFHAPSGALIGGTNVFWVDTGGAGTRSKTDMILYNRVFAAGTGPSVECASCHDPHTSNTTFLRIANTGSAVCLACHNK